MFRSSVFDHTSTIMLLFCFFALIQYGLIRFNIQIHFLKMEGSFKIIYLVFLLIIPLLGNSKRMFYSISQRIPFSGNRRASIRGEPGISLPIPIGFLIIVDWVVNSFSHHVWPAWYLHPKRKCIHYRGSASRDPDEIKSRNRFANDLVIRYFDFSSRDSLAIG